MPKYKIQELSILRTRMTLVVVILRIVEQRSSAGPGDKGINDNTTRNSRYMDRPLGSTYARAQKQHWPSACGTRRSHLCPEIK